MRNTIQTVVFTLASMLSVSVAQGQVAISLVNGEDIPAGVEARANKDDCAANAVITLNLPQTETIQQVDVWVTTSGACEQVDARGGGAANATCFHVGSVNVVSGTVPTFEVTLNQLTTALSTVCADSGTAAGVSVKIYGITTGNVMEQGMLEADQWGFDTLIVDATAPAAPDLNASSVSGDTEVEIEWTATPNEETPSYRVYFDKDVDAECKSSKLVSGGSPVAGLQVGDTGAATTVTLNPEVLGLEKGAGADVGDADVGDADVGDADVGDADVGDADVGDAGVGDANVPAEDAGTPSGKQNEGAVYVTTVDIAGNESPLSEPVCIRRVEAFGFCTDEICDDGSCSLAPGRQSSLPPWLAISFLGVIMLRRRGVSR